MEISDKVGIIGLVFVALGGGYTLLRNFVSHRRSVIEKRCSQCHADSQRNFDNLKTEITRVGNECKGDVGRVERDLAGHIANNRDDHKRIHERIDALNDK